MSGARSDKSLTASLRDFVSFRLRSGGDWLHYELLGRLKHRVWRRLLPAKPYPEPLRLHVGCGRESLEGWLNVDLQPLLTADVSLDVTRRMPFRDVELIFAEHFLEHLPPEAALAFLRAAHDVLRPDGWMRLSTPNLDWVWAHVYRPIEEGEERPPESRQLEALRANRSFYGWQHRFLWNRELLARALFAAGFDELRWCRHGESSQPELRGLERHETYDDTDALPHVLIVEARRGKARPRDYLELEELLRREFTSCLEG